MNVKSKIESNFRVPVFVKLALGVFVFFMLLMGCSPSRTTGATVFSKDTDIGAAKCNSQNQTFSKGDTIIQMKGKVRYEPTAIEKDTSSYNQQFIDGEIEIKK